MMSSENGNHKRATMHTEMLVVSERLWSEGGGEKLVTHLILGLFQEFIGITVITGTLNPAVYKDIRFKPSLEISSRKQTRSIYPDSHSLHYLRPTSTWYPSHIN